ncbi:hypothetical protein VTO42DRAFT_8241 [Malbranchea cinnamomea]
MLENDGVTLKTALALHQIGGSALICIQGIEHREWIQPAPATPGNSQCPQIWLREWLPFFRNFINNESKTAPRSMRAAGRFLARHLLTNDDPSGSKMEKKAEAVE